MKLPRFNIQCEVWNFPKTYYLTPPDCIAVSRDYPDEAPTPITEADMEDGRLKIILDNLSEETILIEFLTDEVGTGPESHLHIFCPACNDGKSPGTDVYFEERPQADIDKFGIYIATCDACHAQYLVFGLVAEAEDGQRLIAKPVRRLRFRAWDPEERVMRNQVWIDTEGVPWALVEGKPQQHARWAVMQYTGRMAYNGREIYEGDVITRENSFVVKGKVVWAHDTWWVVFMDGKQGGESLHEFFIKGRVRLKGNIYEGIK